MKPKSADTVSVYTGYQKRTLVYLYGIHDIASIPSLKHYFTSHSTYIVTSTESDGVNIDGFLYPNSM